MFPVIDQWYIWYEQCRDHPSLRLEGGFAARTQTEARSSSTSQIVDIVHTCVIHTIFSYMCTICAYMCYMAICIHAWDDVFTEIQGK